MTLKEWSIVSIRLLRSAVLLVAAVSKFLSPEESLTFLAALRIQNQSLISFIFIGTVFIEFFGGFLVGLAPRLTFDAIGALFGLFTVVMLVAVAYQVSESCGCFGNLIKSEVGPFGIGGNMLLVSLVFYAARQKVHRLALSNVIDQYFNDEKQLSSIPSPQGQSR